MISENERLNGIALFVITTAVLYLLGWHFMTKEIPMMYGAAGLYTDYYKCFLIGKTCVGFEYNLDPIIPIPLLAKIAVPFGAGVYLVSLKKIIFG